VRIGEKGGKGAGNQGVRGWCDKCLEWQKAVKSEQKMKENEQLLSWNER